MDKTTCRRVIAIVGPTGSGKSELSLILAEALGAEVLNYDSVQVYKDFDIGSGKLTLTERRGIPHHLLDIAEGNDDMTAGKFAELAQVAARAVAVHGRIPVFAGGTGFYLRAVLDGLSPAPARDEALRIRLTRSAHRRAGVLHRFLRRYDPPSALRIHCNDQQKLLRAVEMTCLARQPATVVQASERRGLRNFAVIKIGLAPDRGLLHGRIDGRTEWMFANGLVEETAGLLQAGIAPGAKPMQSLGYKQALAVVRGDLSIEKAVQECQLRTRQYAKRQMTWFRNDKGVHWLLGFGSERRIQQEALALVCGAAEPATSL